MSKEVYLLVETDLADNISGVFTYNLGVFSSPEVDDSLLEEYYGGKFEVLKFEDVRDSGIEWTKLVRYRDGDGDWEKSLLTLHYFFLDEIN